MLGRFVASVLLAGCISSLSAADVPAPRRPNIVYILADDMGFSDLGCFGGEIATPQLDALARNGLRFTQFYNTARCCPTRASLLTGLYPHQAGIGHMMEDRGFDGYRGELNRRCATIAEVLRPAGYGCYAVGKWHVTKHTQPKTDAEKANWPLQRGFDRFYGTIHGAGSFFDPCSLTRDNALISPFADPEYSGKDYYYTDAIADHAARFVKEHRARAAGSPFFLYVAFTAAHWPMHAREADIAAYRGRYSSGYDAVRRERYERQLKLGVVEANHSKLADWPEGLGETRFREWDVRNMEVYAAMVSSMDRGVGRIVDALRDAQTLDNTLICYLQDNGGCAEGLGRGPKGSTRADSPSLAPLAPETLQRDMIPKQTRDGYPVRQGKGVLAGPADTYIAYGDAWATVSNTPFRKHKHWVHEGGVSTPLIAHWPAGIARRGELESTPGHLIDLMATAADLAGATYPPNRTDSAHIVPMEGVSLAPLFQGQSISREAIYWEHEGNRAVRQGDWKLVATHGKPWELYDIAKDRSELDDLSGAHPDRVRDMNALWQAYARRTGVEDWEKVNPPKR